MVDVVRRGLFTRAWRKTSGAIRPPWSLEETQFVTQCVRCNRCVQACETGVLQHGSGGYPAIDFQRGECTFCYACADACPESLFLSRDTRAWEMTVSIEPGCLAYQAVECRRCQDSCDSAAILFRPTTGGIWQPQLQATACSGCGACVASCPVSAIKMEYSHGSALAGM